MTFFAVRGYGFLGLWKAARKLRSVPIAGHEYCCLRNDISANAAGWRCAYPAYRLLRYQQAAHTGQARQRAHYAADGGTRSDLDGLSRDFTDWRFNLRASNTEPLLRLNVETRGNSALLAQKTDELQQLISLSQA